MKKIIIFLLLLGQIIWILHGGVIVGMRSISVEKIKSFELRSGNGIVKVVCANFFESMRQIIEFSCLAANFSNKKFPVKKEQKQKVSLCFVNFGESLSIKNITSFISWVLGCSIVQKDIPLVNNILLIYLWLMFLYLFLYRLNYFFLRARSSIGDNFLLVRGFYRKK